MSLACLPPSHGLRHDARRKTRLEKASSRRIAKSLHYRDLSLGILERLYTPPPSRPGQLPHQLLAKVWFCLCECGDPGEIHVVGTNPACRKEGCRESLVVFDAVERCAFRHHPNNLPASGRSAGQGLARSLFRREFFRSGRRTEGYLRYYAACVCGVNSFLFCQRAYRDL